MSRSERKETNKNEWLEDSLQSVLSRVASKPLWGKLAATQTNWSLGDGVKKLKGEKEATEVSRHTIERHCKHVVAGIGVDWVLVPSQSVCCGENVFSLHIDSRCEARCFLEVYDMTVHVWAHHRVKNLFW